MQLRRIKPSTSDFFGDKLVIIFFLLLLGSAVKAEISKASAEYLYGLVSSR